ncbi:MAG: DUF2207 domain-containing protein [Flavobacteriales bacterium]|nr:DUF2207 domain-containing protein [Flavobacteriales bacterium]
MIALAILLALIVLVAFYAIGIYNRLVKLKNLVAEAWSGIDVQLKKRYDLIPNLVETVKGYAAHEKETFENVTRARAAAQQATTVEGQQAAENALSGALMNLIAVAERYPDLKANTNFLELQNMLAVVEGDIEKARRYYNGNVREQNTLIESFPSNLIANSYGFHQVSVLRVGEPCGEDRSISKVQLMRRWLLGASVVVAAYAYGQNERINSFHTDLTVAADGQLTVMEEISIHAEGDEFKRGIVRKLPLRFTDHNGREHRVQYELTAVQVFGATSPYHTATEGDDFVLYVGSEGNFLQPGDYPYRITYTTKGQVGFFPDYDEIYWNVNGNGWAFAVDSISAVIHLPPSAQVKQTACYTGSYGSTETACSDSIIDAHTVRFQGRAMDYYEGLTVAVGFQKGVVAEPPPPTLWEQYAVPLVGGIITLLLLLYYFSTWARHGRDPDMPTVIPLFEPPDGLSPASVAMVMHGSEDNDQITPAMISLAVKGHIRIDEKKENVLLGLLHKTVYTIVKLKGGGGLPREEQELMSHMFGGHQESYEIDGTYDPSVQSMASAFRGSLRNQWHELLNKGNNWRFWWIPMLTVAVCVISMIVVHNSFWGDNDVLYIAAFS